MTEGAALNAARKLGQAIAANVELVMLGMPGVVELMVGALFAGGHVLIEDVPGTGKTTLAKALARSIAGSFRRIQCTPDLLPSDVTGFSVFDQRTLAFDFRPGPVFHQVLLVDEINRATPRTQSALLEAMAEGQVTIEGRTLPLPQPFLVLATQNPVELEGTFPLPEAQLDRFLMRLRVGYPSEDEETDLLGRFGEASPLDDLAAVASPAEVLAAQAAVRRVRVEPAVRRYAVQLVRRTRDHEALSLGASPRATLALARVGQALALLAGRDFVLPDDIQRAAPHVLTHRLIAASAARLRGQLPAEVLADLVRSTPVPVERDV